MIKEHRYRIHSFLLLAAFCFSATLLGQPKGLQHGGVAAIISSVILTAVICVFEARIIDFSVNKRKNGNCSSTAAKVILTALLLPLVLTAVFSFFELLGFINAQVLPHSSRWAVAALLLVVVIFTLRSSDNAVFKFTLVALIFCAAASAVVFLLSLKLIKINEITAGNFDWKLFCIYTLKLTGRLCIPALSAVMFITATKGSLGSKQAALGSLTGATGAAVILLQSALILGPEQSSSFAYPYVKAVGVISTGSLFSRLDGIAYMTAFFVYIIKITVSIKAFIITVKLLANKKC